MYRVIFLGDIIDKGPESRQAMDLVIGAVRSVPESQLILGNHDAIPVTIIDEVDPEKADMRLAFWMQRQNGAATLLSYGFDPSTITVDRLRAELDPSHVAFLRDADHYVELDNHILVHAGLRPGILLKKQDSHDLMWIKEPFLTHPNDFEKIIIHGHTVTSSRLPEVYPNRVGIDTGACQTGNLTAVRIVGSKITDFLWTKAENPHHVEHIEPEQRQHRN